MTIRQYKNDDLQAIMNIGNQAYQYIYANLARIYGKELFEFLFPNEKTKTMKGLQIKEFCEKHPQWVYVCEKKGRIVGFITFLLKKNDRIGILGDNAVDPNCGLKGIGQQMYKAVLNYFKQQGMLYAEVRTDMDNIPATKAYTCTGFNIKREQIIYYKKL